jgi:hypothetical protein
MNSEWRMTNNESRTNEWILSPSLMLRPMVSRPVCLGIKHPSGAYDQIFITVGQLCVCWCEALSLTRGPICGLQLLLVLASAVIFRSESRGTRDHILLSQIRDFPFRRLLRLAGLRWRYSTPPPHGIEWILLCTAVYIVYRYPWRMFVACSYPRGPLLNLHLHRDAFYSELVPRNLPP